METALFQFFAPFFFSLFFLFSLATMVFPPAVTLTVMIRNFKEFSAHDILKILKRGGQIIIISLFLSFLIIIASISYRYLNVIQSFILSLAPALIASILIFAVFLKFFQISRATAVILARKIILRCLIWGMVIVTPLLWVMSEFHEGSFP